MGDGTTTHRSTPVQVSSLSDVTAIAGGGLHTIALKSDGTVWAWGYNYFGQLGDGTTTTKRGTPVQVSSLSDVIAIAGGAHYTIALKSDGMVWTWGDNSSGQLGEGTYEDRSTPVQVSGLNLYGTTTPTPASSPTPILTPTLTPASSPTPILTPTIEPGKKCIITGYVVNKRGNPIESAKIRLKGTNSKILNKTSSDEDGLFEFTDLDADTYVITAIKKGYKTVKHTRTLEAGEEKDVEIVMKRTTKKGIHSEN